jgi:hypothetical protein
MSLKNNNLNKARKEKNDEFYTLYNDIEKELIFYKNHFNGKIVYCNCDDPTKSNFVNYFVNNFNELNLKSLIATSFSNENNGLLYEFDGKNLPKITKLQGNGDFRSEECINLLKKSDIIVTNPPFSLFREYIDIMMKFDKKFLVIGNTNAIANKEFFPLIKDNKLWLGCSSFNTGMYFEVPENYVHNETYKFKKEIDGKKVMRVAAICWFTNLEHNRRNNFLNLTCQYSEDKYPKYDNYDAIEVSKVCEIPMDYEGVMGVPITFIDKFNPEQFEIVGWSRHNDMNMDGGYWLGGKNDATINGKDVYCRILIKHKKI